MGDVSKAPGRRVPRPGHAPGEGRPDVSPAVRAALERGVSGRRFLFPESGPARCEERWTAPEIADPSELAELRSCLRGTEEALAPAGRGELLARVLALLSHYRSDPHPPQVETRIADDWAEDLGGFPMWAVDAAARRWRRSRKFRPQICEMIELCENEVRELAVTGDRLRSIVDGAGARANPLSRMTSELARGMLPGMPR